MSEKLKEFMEVPQQFVKDGNQVCIIPPVLQKTVSHWLYSS